MRNIYQRSISSITKHLFFAFVVLVAADATKTQAQVADIPSTVTTMYHSSEPEKINFENGFKLVYKSKGGEPVRVVEYVNSGSIMRVTRKVKETYVSWVANDGKSHSVTVETYDESQTGSGVRVTLVSRLAFEGGVLIEKADHKGNNGSIDFRTSRTVTRYPAGSGPEGVTQRERFDLKLDKWIKISPLAGKWRLEIDGNQQAGEYTFAESAAITEIRHDSKVWLLMFGPIVEKRNVVLPGESKDHLAFAKRLIQLRGNANEGRLEFWLTPDLTTSEFQTTKYALVRDGN